MRRIVLCLLAAVLASLATTTVPEAIMSDYADGTISRYDELLNLVRFVKYADQLPEEYRPYLAAGPLPSGTPFLIYVRDHLFELTPAQQEELNGLLLARPAQIGYYQSSSYSIRYHYYQAGQEAYAQEGLGYADYSWFVETSDGTDDRLWPPPPDLGVGGSNDYDFYLENIGGSVLGYTSPEYRYTPYTDRYSYTSYIAIDIGQDENAYKSTVCHELAHAIHMGADYAESRMHETSAVYHEDIVYPGSGHDYQMVGAFQQKPYQTLIGGSGTLFEYGSWIWFKYLEQRWFDADGFWYDDMWRDSIQPGSVNDPDIFETLSDLLNNEGTNIRTAFLDFSIWRVFTGGYSDDYHWEHDIGESVAFAWSHTVGDYPVEDFTVPADRLPQTFAMNVVYFATDTNHEMFGVSFDGQDHAGSDPRMWKAALVGIRRDGGAPDIWYFDLDNEWKAGTVIVDDWFPYTKLAMVCVNLGKGDADPDNGNWGTSATYTYSAQITDTDAPVADFSGHNTDSGVLLSWSVNGDAGGINVYRESTCLNSAPLPVSAGRYLDRDFSGGTYWLGVVDYSGDETMYGPVTVTPTSDGQAAVTLEQNFPSPAGNATTIRFALAESQSVRLAVYDLSGRLVVVLANGEMAGGTHDCVWRTDSVANGLYIYRLETAEQVLSRRLTVAH